MRRKKGARVRGERMPMMTVPGQIVPDKILVSLPYFVSIPIITTGAKSFATVFRNSAFDPEYAVGFGHQPLGYDQWEPFYQNCRVYGVSGTVKFCNETVIPWFVSLYYTDNAGTIPAAASNTAFEQPGVKPRLIGILSGGHDVVTLKVKWSPKTLLGMTTNQFKDNINTAGTMGVSNPVTETYMSGMGWTTDDSLSAGGQMMCMFDLVYHCELFGRKALATS